MKVFINEEVDYRKWGDLLRKTVFENPFQTQEYYEFINTVDGMAADVFALAEYDEFQALLVVTKFKEKGIKSFFSRRGIVFGGPLINNRANLAFLLHEVTTYYKRTLIYLEVRNSYNYSDYKSDFIKSGWNFSDHFNVQIAIDKSMEALLADMKYNRRREIRLSYQEGAFVEETSKRNDIMDLFEILSDLYKNRVRLPLPGFDFFDKLVNSKVGKCFIVKHGDKVIGGSFCCFNKKAIYTLYYVGVRDYHKKIYPTHLSIIGAMDFAINNELQIVDLMGAGKPNLEHGVRKYKMEFGGELREDGRYIIVLNKILYNIGTKAIHWLKSKKINR